jgi:hypothetical protein
MGAANKNLPNTYFRGPKEGLPKKGPYASSYIKDQNERLNESKLENDNKRVGSLRQPLTTYGCTRK